MRHILLTVCALSLTFLAHAREIKVATIKSDTDYNTTHFYLELKDDNTIDSLRFVLKASNGGVLEDETHPSERVIENGVVLNQNGNYKVIVLKVEKTFSTVTGGTVILDYLYNAATGVRRFMKIKLVKSGDDFVIRDLDNKLVKSFYVYGNRTIFGLVGVKYIEALGAK